MKNIFFLILLELVFICSAISSPIDTTTAKITATNQFLSRASTSSIQRVRSLASKQIELELVHQEFEEVNNQSNSDPYYYVYNVKGNNGYIIISADDDLIPVLAYSFDGSYDKNNLPPAFVSWMKNYKDQIKLYKYYLNKNKYNSDSISTKSFTKFRYKSKLTSTEVVPLLSTTWDQGKFYNYYCPIGIETSCTSSIVPNPGGHTYAGCAAVVMGQIMKKWSWPIIGNGIHEDINKFNNKTLTANLGTTIYDWSSMPNAVISEGSTVAQLLSDAGIASNTEYGSCGSGSQPQYLMDAMVNHFRYKSSLTLIDKSLTANGWEEKIIDELSSGRPVLYIGSDKSESYHIFICDGCTDYYYFHFNWGWGGKFDGYFFLDDLTPGNIFQSEDYTFNQAAIIGITPDYKPDLTPVSKSLSTSSIQAGSSLTAYCAEDNSGSVAAGSNVISIYLSTDPVLNKNGDIFIDNIDVGSLAAKSCSAILPKTIQIPPNVPANTYYVYFWADGDEVVDEIFEDNNFASAMLTVTAATVLATSPASSLSFYDAVVNRSKDKTIKVTNNSATNVLLTGLGFTGINKDEFSVQPLPPFLLQAGVTENFTVTFSPKSTGEKTATLNISNNTSESPTNSIAVKGNGTDHETKVLVCTPASTYNFGDTKVNNSKSKLFTLLNTGSNTISVNNLMLEGTNPDSYIISSPLDPVFNIETGASKQIDIKSSPASIGVKNAQLVIYSDADNGSPKYSIELYGNGKENPYSGNNSIIISYEYWFDDNYTNKVYAEVPPQTPTSINKDFSTRDLKEGLHFLHFRMKDSKGKWSSIVSEAFHKLTVFPDSVSKINSYEYWFNNDYDQRVTSQVTPAQTEILNKNLKTKSLSSGLHSYHIRYQDNVGQWSSVVSEFFNKLPVSEDGTRKITAYEYWFDNDYDGKIFTEVTPDQTISTNNGLSAASLPNGLHNYHIRYKDDLGQWSSVMSEMFQKLNVTGNQPNKIIAYRYWFDRDEKNIIIENIVNADNPYILIRNLNTCNLSIGEHTIHFQFKDSHQVWSAVTNNALTKSAASVPEITINGTVYCQGETITLTAGNADSYLWNTGATTQSINVTTSGNYSVRVNPESSCSLTSNPVSIVMNPQPDAAGVISGATKVSNMQNNVTYSVPLIKDATAYTWTIPAEATGTSVTNSIILNFNSTAQNGQVVELKVKGHNFCGDGTESTLSITIDNSVGFNNLVYDNEISIYPNPVESILKVNISKPFDNDYKLNIYNSLGVMIHSTVKSKVETEFNVDVSNYPPGMYFIKLSNDRENSQKKVIKK